MCESKVIALDLDRSLRRPRTLGRDCDSSIPGFGGLRLSECPIRSPEPEGVRERLLAFTHLRAGVDIE